MTAPASIAWLFIFLVDIVTLYHIWLLRDERLIATAGLSTFIDFFVVSFGPTFSLAMTALVSQALDAGERGFAVRWATLYLVITVVVLCIAMGAAHIFRGAVPLAADLAVENRNRPAGKDWDN